MHKILKLALTGILIISVSSSVSSADERSDLMNLVDEMNYLISKAEHMKVQNQGKPGRLKFNYNALLAQLKQTRHNTILFLNSKGEKINKQAPIHIDDEMRIYK